MPLTFPTSWASGLSCLLALLPLPTPSPVKGTLQFTFILITLHALPRGWPTISKPVFPSYPLTSQTTISVKIAMLIIIICLVLTYTYIYTFAKNYVHSWTTQYEETRWPERWLSLLKNVKSFQSLVHNILWFNLCFYLILPGKKSKPNSSLNSESKGYKIATCF